MDDEEEPEPDEDEHESEDEVLPDADDELEEDELELEEDELDPEPAGRIITGSQHYVSPVGDGVNSTFTISHNLGTRDLHVTVRQNGGSRAIVEPVAVTLDGEDDLSITFAEAPALNGYVAIISTAGPVSAFQMHGHTIAQIEGLQLILDDLGGRVESLESFIPTSPPGVSGTEQNAIAPGQVFVVTGEGGRVMRWAGDASAGASVSVTADFSGLHVVHPGFPAHFTRSGDFYHDGPVYEDVLGSGCKVVRLPANTADFGLASVNIARWVLVGSSGNSGATAPAAGTTPPWSATWSSGSVARNIFAAPANWEILRETYQAFVFPYGYYRINGIDCYSYSVFFIGWLAEGGAPSVRDYGNGNPIPYDLARFTRFSVKPPSGYYGLTEAEPISDGETFFRTIKAPAGRVIYLEMS